MDDVPWFHATDVCSALGVGNVSQAVANLDEDEKSLFTPSLILNDSGLPNQPANYVNETGLYALILRSRKPEAKAFKRGTPNRTVGYVMSVTF